jgi:pimeloyl-ACP methyl ester carboxylesterase
VNEAKYRAAETRLWESVGLRPIEHRVTLPRIGVGVRVQEIGEGEPVVFVHGGPNSGSTWASLVRHLDGLRCLLVDRPGTGLSDPFPVRPDNLDWFGDVFVGDLLDALGLETAHVVASSFGGFLALRSDAAEPGRIQRMVQMACPAFAPGQLVPSFMKGLGIAPLRWLIGVLPPSRRANDSIMRQIGHGASLDAGRIPGIFLDWYLALQRYTQTMKNDGAMIGSIVSRGRMPTISDSTLAAVTAPTLFLWGCDDGFGDEEVAKGMVARMRDPELLMIPDSGHLPWLDFPELVAGHTSTWLASVRAETPDER